MQIQTGSNSFDIEIEKQNHENVLVITAILSRKEYEYRSRLFADFVFPTDLGIEFIEGGERSYDLAIGYSKTGINSKQISNVINSEKGMVAKLISGFIQNIEDFKLSDPHMIQLVRLHHLITFFNFFLLIALFSCLIYLQFIFAECEIQEAPLLHI